MVHSRVFLGVNMHVKPKQISCYFVKVKCNCFSAITTKTIAVFQKPYSLKTLSSLIPFLIAGSGLRQHLHYRHLKDTSNLN